MDLCWGFGGWFKKAELYSRLAAVRKGVVVERGRLTKGVY